MNKYPLIRFVIIFICGIILQHVFHFESSTLLYLFILLFVITSTVLFIQNEKLVFTKQILTIFSILICGAVYLSFSSKTTTQYPFNEAKIKNSVVTGKIVSVDLMKKDRFVFNMVTDTLKLNNGNFPQNIQLLVKVSDSQKNINKLYNKIRIGNTIKLKGTLIKPRNERNPGEFDYEKYLSAKRIAGLLYIYKTKDIKLINNEESFFPDLVFQTRKSIDAAISSFHNKSTAALLRGLLLADKSLIENDLRDEFVNAGVIHVLAVSGLHVGFIILIFIFLFKRFNVYLRYILTIIGLLLFMIITNSPASVTRATIMAVAIILAPLTGRTYNSINSLALAAFVILLFDPLQLFSPGFQLSFSAVLSIVVIYPMISSYIYKLKVHSKIIKYVLLFCAVSFAAQIGTLPFILVYFHRFSIVALFANFFVIPLIGLIVGLGIFTVVIAPVSGFIAGIYASANELLSYILFNIVDAFGSRDYSYISIHNFSLLDSVIFFVMLGLVIATWRDIKTYRAKIAILALAVFTTLTWMRIDNYELLEPNKLSVMAIDIGQGDSFLIKFPNGETALIDAGEANKYFDNGKSVIAPLLDRLGVDKIDYGFISHVDSDHYRGFIYLIESGFVKQVFKPKIDSTLQKDVELEKFLNTNGIPIKYYSKDILRIGNARLYILNDTTRNNFTSLSMNDKSGVMKLVYGKSSFLFTGDAGTKSERFYINSYGNFLESEVLKAGHHGSKTSSSKHFIDIVKPKMSIISAGIANKFKHPNKETLLKFKNAGITILRTDVSGAILLQSDGFTIKNINWKKQESGFIF